MPEYLALFDKKNGPSFLKKKGPPQIKQLLALEGWASA
jgi:hypothetical protein